MSDFKRSKVCLEITPGPAGPGARHSEQFSSGTRLRRQSYGFSRVSGIGKTTEKINAIGAEFRRPPLLYLNTYQLNPRVAFHSPSVMKAANKILDEQFDGHKYNPQNSPSTALIIAGQLMRAVKAMGFNRYRIISVVTIAQRKAQSYNNAVCFLWDNIRDNYININRELPTCFIQGIKAETSNMTTELKRIRMSMAVPKSQTQLGEGRINSRLRMRRTSFGFGSISGVGRMTERVTMFAPEFKRPVLLFLNTYQLKSYKPFHVPSVKKAADELLDELFENHKYNPQESPALALRISGEIMKAVKAMSFNRYRVISIVTIAQKRAQSYNNAISFLWDHTTDNLVNINRELPTVFIQVTVFGVYLD